jgi:hypothetical protein
MEACDNASAPVDLIRLLLEKGADATYQDVRGCTALYCVFSNYGLAYDRPEITALLLEYGANVNAATRRGYTALHKCVDKGFVQSTRLLIKAGADVNAVSKCGRTPLTMCHRSERLIAEMLLIAGANHEHGCDYDDGNYLSRVPPEERERLEALRGNYFGKLAQFITAPPGLKGREDYRLSLDNARMIMKFAADDF